MLRKSEVLHSLLATTLFSAVFAIAASASRAGDPDQKILQMLVEHLADKGHGFDTPEAVAASRILAEYGTRAFAVLIENLDDDRPACECFQQDTSDRTTVGAACRGIIQGQVEKYMYLGKASPRYLETKDLKTWWRENSQKDLLQLQIEAIEWSIGEIETNDRYKSLRTKLNRSLKELQAQQRLEKRIRDS